MFSVVLLEYSIATCATLWNKTRERSLNLTWTTTQVFNPHTLMVSNTNNNSYNLHKMEGFIIASEIFLFHTPVVLSWWTILDECLGRLANALVGCIPLRPQNPLWSYSSSVPNIHDTIFLTSLSYPRQNHLWSLPYGAWLFMIWCDKQILRVNNFMESLTLLAPVQSAYFLFFWSCTTS